MSQSHSASPQDTFVPEILAPVGGREQFFAALNSGADAVFLGLRNFNARARAENFTIEDLRELVPIARHHGMNVLVTMNILIKNSELTRLVETLAALEDIGVHAIIVQDLGLARICKSFFPNLRMHASTQLAVHNLDGVREAMKLGFKRVVLARELTAVEIKKIRSVIPREEVELEAFCHGSLCYSYSGLCFFSGAEDARSGNRGECSYTCRKPYKILNEPGHGFLFSMKDLNTIESLELLVDAGVDTLKIEGRKKDAQYVSGVVQAYRQRLNEIFKRETLRSTAPAAAHAESAAHLNGSEDIYQQLNLTFQRQSTSFFLKGRYHENVIDLDNPTHKGEFVGTIHEIRGRMISLVSQCALERFDGLRIDPNSSLYHATPQHGREAQSTVDGVRARYENKVCHFSLRKMLFEGRVTPEIRAGSRIEIEIPDDLLMPAAGDRVFRTRSDALRRKTEQLSRPPAALRMRPTIDVDLRIEFSSDSSEFAMTITALKHGISLLTRQKAFPALRPRSGTSTLCDDICESFSTFGNINVSVQSFSFAGDSNWFVSRSQLKELKRTLEAELPLAHQKFLSERMTVALESITSTSPRAKSQRAEHSGFEVGSQLAIKIDRLEYLPWLSEFIDSKSSAHSTEHIKISELIFEPKRAFLPDLNFQRVIADLLEFSKNNEIRLRLALPTVLRAWDEPIMKRWALEFFAAGITAVEIGNIGHFAMLERWGIREQVTSLSSDFTLYSLNQEAAALWSSRGVDTIALSVEDDCKNIALLLAGFPESSSPQAILYKDTPLFIAESCSLTALHNGCPTSKVCGYRTLEIQNDEGDIFYVAHESCKSVVYAQKPFAVSQHRGTLEQAGIRNFRADFLTRKYEKETVLDALNSIFTGKTVASTHTANFNRILL